jgi:hypothetical protein
MFYDSLVPPTAGDGLTVKENLQNLAIRRSAGADNLQRSGNFLFVGNYIYFLSVHDPCSTYRDQQEEGSRGDHPASNSKRQ